MEGYQGLLWKTRSGASPQGRPRVYLCCHPDDFERYFEPISDEILDIQHNAAVWYYNPIEGVPSGEEFLDNLAQMQLFVVPVTSAFVYGESQARDVELSYALGHNIPVLPLVQEAALEEGYGRVFGDLQYLNRETTEADPTAVPYEERLEKYLSSVLVGDELVERVRAAFDAYVFLSYRKRDRAAAQRIMRLIHEDELCRDVAVWYDEFLVPGEGFNQAILDALRRCSVFALVVTPSLLEDPNYVLTTEWPTAYNAGKPALPVEAEPTDAAELAQLYAGLGEAIPEADRTAVAKRLVELLCGIDLAENDDDPAHNYLVGLAYLMGIDVEVNHERALELITSAADAGLIEAMERLVAMYNTGEGVVRDYREAIAWQERLVGVLRDRVVEGASAKDLNDMYSALADLGDQLLAVGDPTAAIEVYMEMLQCAEEFISMGIPEARRNLSIAIGKYGKAQHALGYLENALNLYVQSAEILETLAEETGTVEARWAYSVSLILCGNIRFEQGYPESALTVFERSLNILESLAEETGAFRIYRDLSVSLCSCGDAQFYLREYKKARAMYERSLGIREVLVKETGTVEARRDLSVVLAQIGDTYLFLYEHESAIALYEKSLDIFRSLALETGTVQARRDLVLALCKTGDTWCNLGDQKGALVLYEQALAISEILVEETGTIRARDSLADSLYHLSLLDLYPTNKRRECLKRILAISEELLEQTGSPRYEAFVQCANRGLAKLKQEN